MSEHFHYSLVIWIPLALLDGNPVIDYLYFDELIPHIGLCTLLVLSPVWNEFWWPSQFVVRSLVLFYANCQQDMTPTPAPSRAQIEPQVWKGRRNSKVQLFGRFCPPAPQSWLISPHGHPGCACVRSMGDSHYFWGWLIPLWKFSLSPWRQGSNLCGNTSPDS